MRMNDERRSAPGSERTGSDREGKRSKWRRGLLACALVLIVLAGGYGLKTRMGINLFESFSIMRILHVHEIQAQCRRWWRYPQPGVLISDTFRQARSDPARISFCSHGPAPARYGYLTRPGPGLRIENPGKDEWTYTYRTYFPVSSDERFAYRVRFFSDPGVSLEFGLILYAADGRVKEWHYAASREKGTRAWRASGRELVIPEGTDSVRFYLSGRGRGDCAFAEVELRKLALREPLIP
jgi:hypothetical protein